MRTEDGSIIQECLDGKPVVFGILVDKYKEGIYAYMYTEIQSFHDTQEVFDVSGETPQSDLPQQEFMLAPHRDADDDLVWEAAEEMPTARGGLYSISVNGKIYAIGGMARFDGELLTTVEEYDPATDSWTQKSNMPFPLASAEPFSLAAYPP